MCPPAVRPSCKCHFFRLPGELRNMIYEFAYTEAKIQAEDIMRGRSHELSEEKGLRHGFHIIDVNRRFFFEAFPYFIRYAQFVFDRHYRFASLCDRYPLLQDRITRIRFNSDYIRRCSIPELVYTVNICPNLVDVEVLVPTTLHYLDSGLKVYDSLGKELKNMYGLERFVMRPRGFTIQNVRTRLKTVEKEVRERVTKDSKGIGLHEDDLADAFKRLIECNAVTAFTIKSGKSKIC